MTLATRYATLTLAAALSLSGCASPQLPARDPQQAWVDFFTRSGTLIMADQLDGTRTQDGRFFQVSPGRHEMVVRFDYEMKVSGFESDPAERICYLTLDYAGFEAGKHYRVEGRAIALQASARLWDGNRVVAEHRQVHCIP